MSKPLTIDWTGLFDAPSQPLETELPIEDLQQPLTEPLEPSAQHLARLDIERAQKSPERFADDDRRWCIDCQRLTQWGRCTAPAAGLLVASRQYEPAQTMPRRCVAYLPCCCDPIKTPGAVRWPWLNDGA